MSIREFIFSKFFLKNLAVAMILVLVLTFVLNSKLKKFTDFGEAYSVPDLSGFTMEEVKDKFNDLPFTYEISDSADYFGQKKPLEIIDQYPSPAAQVKRGRTIYLTVNKTVAGQVGLPDMIDRHYMQAKYMLERDDFLLDTLVYIKHPFKNLVVDVRVGANSVRPGTKLQQGTAVTLVLGDGIGNTENLVPCLVGLTIQEASFIIQSNYFSVGLIIGEEEVSDTSSAIIYLQEPECDSFAMMRIGEPINLFIKQDFDVESNETIE